MSERAIAASISHYALTRSAQTLIGICSGLVADGTLNDKEIGYLRTWLTEHADVASIWPGDVIASRIERILADGIITDSERNNLIDLLSTLSGNEFAGTGSASLAGPGVPYDAVEIIFPDMSFCLTGTFFFGTRARCERALEELGGIPAATVSNSLDYLIVGGGCNANWANETYGRKIEAAIERKRKHGRPAIVPERDWHAAMIKALAEC